MANIDQDLQAIMNARYGRDVRQSIHDAIRDMNVESTHAEEVAISSQSSAQNNAILAESYTKGGTGSRTGEDTDNAEYYKNEAERLAGVYAVEDNLTSTSTIHSLSANQGRVLNGKVTDIENSVGSANGIATLDGTGRVPYSQLPESAMEFKGTWNANTNTPTLTAGVGDTGDFYVVSVGGTWHGMTFNPNDRIVFDGVTAHDWIKLVAGEVNSVNGMSGQVQLNSDDIPFDNTGSGIVADDVEGAIKEVFLNAGAQVQEVTMSYYIAHKSELDASGDLIVITDSGLANTASNVTYDNTDSGLVAENVQGAIDEIDDKTKWKELRINEDGGTFIGLVAGAVEYLVVAKYGTVSISFSYIPQEGYVTIYGGFYLNSTNNCRARLDVASVGLSVDEFEYNSTDVLSSTKFSVWYR